MGLDGSGQLVCMIRDLKTDKLGILMESSYNKSAFEMIWKSGS